MSRGRGEDGPDDHAEADSRRLDRWLWFVRVVKSRTMAAGLVEAGKVRVNREKTTKPSHLLKVGDVVTVAAGAHVRVLKVVAMGERRGPASEARALFEDLTPPRPPRSTAEPVAAPVERSPGAGRPTKRDRRLTERLIRDE